MRRLSWVWNGFLSIVFASVSIYDIIKYTFIPFFGFLVWQLRPISLDHNEMGFAQVRGKEESG